MPSLLKVTFPPRRAEMNALSALVLALTCLWIPVGYASTVSAGDGSQATSISGKRTPPIHMPINFNKSCFSAELSYGLYARDPAPLTLSNSSPPSRAIDDIVLLRLCHRALPSRENLSSQSLIVQRAVDGQNQKQPGASLLYGRSK